MKKDSYLLLRIQEACESLVDAGHFSSVDLKSRFWQIMMDELSKQYTMFIIGNKGFFKCHCMPFELCTMPATFQKLMQNCLWEVNLTYSLIYLDDIIVFLQIAEECLHHLCVIFDWFREDNLKVKPSKCNFFQEWNYLPSPLSHKGWGCPSDSNLKADTECAPPQTYMEVSTFLCLVDHYRKFMKGFTCIALPLSEYLAREGASRKSE